MSRNDQAVRQWLLLQKLEGKRGLTIDELARALPQDYACHARTVRRDLEALEVVFPLLTERVEGKTRWRLAGCAAYAESSSRGRFAISGKALQR